MSFNRKEYMKKWKDENKEHNKDYMREYRSSDHGRYVAYRNTATERGMSFNLPFEAFVELTHDVCFYCGQKSSGKDIVGIDRIDSGKSYELDNVLPCCFICNFMKRDMELFEWIEHINKIHSKFFITSNLGPKLING